MKKNLLFAFVCILCIDAVNAAVRDETAVNRTAGDNTTTNAIVARTATNQTTRATNSQNATRTSSTSTVRNAGNIINRSATNRTTVQQNISRSATNPRSSATTASSARNATNTSVVRSATNARKTVTNISQGSSKASIARAATQATNTFGTGYNICRDAYFTCMDQFCATANTTYRRCVCSSRLTDIQDKERALSQAANQLQDFKDLNIEVIPKTAAEVNAMISASEGESSLSMTKNTTSETLAGISEILSSNKSKSLSTLGTLDIAGDINQIWATTDLASGQAISNLTGESLYNAVHAQCSELVKANCGDNTTLQMVVSAYGMYIENDCTTLLNTLDSQLQKANSTIRETEREMNLARLENYNAHNSTSINDCIAQVRKDITADTACGTDYVHCLDITGRYLNRDTGEPIYSRDFYQLQNQTSLDGDVLTNPTNRMLVAELNRKRAFAENGLSTCRDIADEVWDEFMRQAITEIYQGQQAKIRDVKNDCLDTVNLCYDEQSESLKDFSNIKEELLLGSRLELSEELCQEKLYACSNLYGDPNGDGLNLLISAMHDITDQKIAKECRTLLEEYAQDLCTVPSNDSLHSYPYACRVYAPGDQIYASNWYCNQLQWSTNTGGTTDDSIGPAPANGYNCPTFKRYKSCNFGYYLATLQTDGNWIYTSTPMFNNACIRCPSNAQCAGGTTGPVYGDESGDGSGAPDCGTDYAGSLYQKVVKYATQVCIRPSELENIISGKTQLPTNILEDVNVVMDSIRVSMSQSLSAECDRLGGTWVNTPWVEGSTGGTTLFKAFYDETGANTKWGYCADPSSISTLNSGN